jgi:hypothetical protein
MNGAMRFVDPQSLVSLAEESLTRRLELIESAAQGRFGAEGYEVVAVHADSVAMIRRRDASAIRVRLMESDEGFDFGPMESVEVDSFAHEAEWAAKQAVEIAGLIAEGDIETTRNRVHLLSEAVSKGNAYTAEGLLRRLQDKLESRASWVDVYATREREVRSYIHGEIGPIRESIPTTRFRVLATEHAPDDPEQYRDELVQSFQSVLKLYQGVVDTMESVDQNAGSLITSFLDLEEGMLLQNLTGFAASLRESAGSVSRYGNKFLHLESGSGDLPRLSRLHDLLAEGLEDYLICATFVRKLVSDITSSESPS